MTSFRACILVAGILISCCGPAFGSDWVFKGQPKDGSENFQSSEAQQKSRSQRENLLSTCNAVLKKLEASKGTTAGRDPSFLMGLVSCGLIFGVDHQQDKSALCLNAALEHAAASNDLKKQAEILNNMGIVHALWGRFSEAIAYHEKALSITVGTKEYGIQAQSYGQMGHIAMFRGDYGKASAYLDKSVNLYEKSGDKSQSWLTLDNLGQLNQALGNHEKALNYYRQSLVIKKNFGLTGGMVASYFLIGNVHDQIAKTSDALVDFQEGLGICAKHGYPIDLLTDRIGNLYLDRGEVNQAEPLITKAGFWQSLGRLYLEKKEPDRAKPYYLKLLDWSEKRQMPDYLWVAHTGLGTINEQHGDLKAAAGHFRAAVENIERVRESLSAPERSTFFQLKSGGFVKTAPYEGLARVLIKMGKSGEAFRMSEFTKARTFSEALSRKAPSTSVNVPAEIISADASINEELSVKSKALNDALEQNDGRAAFVLRPQVEAVREKFAAHVKNLRKTVPVFASTKYPEPLNVEETALKDDERAIVYDVTDPGIIIQLVQGKKIVKTAFKHVPRAEIDNLVALFRKPLELEANESVVEKLNSFDFDSGTKLFDILIRDFVPEIPQGASIIIVPDESLGALPFEALVMEPGKIVPGKGFPIITQARFLGDGHSISYSQSLTALTIARTLKTHTTSPKRMLVVVDPVFSAEDSRLAELEPDKKKKIAGNFPNEMLMSIKSRTGITFPRLPLTGSLGESLKKNNPESTDLYEGLRANKETVESMDLTGYGSIIFGTHGYFGSSLPGIREPVLVLTLTEEDKGRDGFLRLTEVMSLKINANIAALVACQTGIGRQVSGEGTIGMGRGFQYAGADCVLMSLWSVAEQSSVLLVEKFFRHVREGRSRREALNLAIKEIRQSGYNHPFFWAPFILVGESG